MTCVEDATTISWSLSSSIQWRTSFQYTISESRTLPSQTKLPFTSASTIRVKLKNDFKAIKKNKNKECQYKVQYNTMNVNIKYNTIQWMSI